MRSHSRGLSPQLARGVRLGQGRTSWQKGTVEKSCPPHGIQERERDREETRERETAKERKSEDDEAWAGDKIPFPGTAPRDLLPPAGPHLRGWPTDGIGTCMTWHHRWTPPLNFAAVRIKPPVCSLLGTHTYL